MFYANVEERRLKGSKVLGTFMERADGYVKFYIRFSNGSVLAMTVFENREAIIDSEEVVKRLGYEVTLDKGPLARGRECEQTVINPDILEDELRRIRSRVFNSETVMLCPMKTPVDRKGYFTKFGKRFEEWYLSLGTQK